MGTPFRTLALDARAEESVAGLRMIAAAVVGAVAIAIALSSPPLSGWVCALLSLGAAGAWVAMGLGARRRLVDAARHQIVLTQEGITLVEGAKERRVAWGEVTGIGVDEERLVVRVDVAGAEPLAIEPRYGGMGAYDLERTIQAARDAAGADPCET